ncbi:MAG TPA: patatin-like phospholipase family protein [Acidimicrobiales bacterium]|nr:patatin-like phospholipase family protein [Acidimicrobiales bacterium]
MTAVALVLGAGGAVGGAYHAGALAALSGATGWDPRSAGLIVGTSAGASTAASLRAGLAADDLLARVTGRSLSDEGATLVGDDHGPRRHADLGDPEAPDAPRPRWWFVPQAPWLLGPAFLRAGPPRWGVALAGMAPSGRLTTTAIGDRVRAEMGAGVRWPAEPTWVVAYRTRDARRVVFGRDDVEVADLAQAVEASSAVPARFAPVRAASGRYLDGAVFSPTNADLVAGLGFDLVVVSSPMTATEECLGNRTDLGERTRAWFGRLLAREVAAVEAKGTRVLVLQPGPTEMAAIRSDLPAHERVVLVADAAHESVRVQLATEDAGELVTHLSSD